MIVVSSCFFLTPATLSGCIGEIVENSTREGTSYSVRVYLKFGPGAVPDIKHVATVGTFANIASAKQDADRYGLYVAIVPPPKMLKVAVYGQGIPERVKRT